MDRGKRIVVKVGTNVLTKADGTLDKLIFRQLVVQLVKAIGLGYRPVLVSSGAVGAGRSIIGDCGIEDEAIRRQVLSSVGQPSLMKRYYELFHEYDVVCAQVLATKEDFTEGDHYQNMVNCFEGLLSQSIVPIVNENDVVSLTELMFTDNDELAGLTAHMIQAEKLIILSNVEGLFTGDPTSPASSLIPAIPLNEEGNVVFTSSGKSAFGRGGMTTKYDIASQAAKRGIEAVIANGKKENILLEVLEGKQVGTRFLTTEWIPEGS